MTEIDMYGALPGPPVEEPQGCFSIAGFVKNRWENNQHYVDQFAGHPWEPAIHAAAESLRELCPRINISQIKEKFGELRLYIRVPDDLGADEMPAWAEGDAAKVRDHADRIIAHAEGWCAGRDHEAHVAQAAEPASSPDFERGARAAEAMRFYFLDEDERSIHTDLSAAVLEQHEAGAVADALRDEQLRLERLGDRRPLVVPSAHRVLPTGYAASELVDKNAFEVAVEWRGQDPRTGLDRWAVTHMGRCLSAEGTWEHEPLPSSRDEGFLRRFRFSLREALRLATTAVDGVRINGRTLAQWDERVASSSGS